MTNILSSYKIPENKVRNYTYYENKIDKWKITSLKLQYYVSVRKLQAINEEITFHE